jgi:2,4-dienoyl-CoA reductase-like NADH-dependent reductase (Old Yellow Enzyme family)
VDLHVELSAVECAERVMGAIGAPSTALTVAEIETIIEQFGATAKCGKEAGLDGIEFL